MLPESQVLITTKAVPPEKIIALPTATTAIVLLTAARAPNVAISPRFSIPSFSSGPTIMEGALHVTNSIIMSMFCATMHVRIRGGSRIFLRGEADFQKIFQNFDDLFFRSNKLIFRALPKHCFASILAKFSAPQPNF